ncbi:MAG: geranylgeranyl reductase family protein [Clostridia bacterium]|nr:geranylgeranyl reductase family protein [Clostridia bacterium]
MNHVVDTLIIGAGPAGLSCGIRLCKRGVSNLVVEKRSFPRDKTCGGGVTNKTYRLLSEELELPEEALSKIFCDENDVLELFFGDLRLTHSKIKKPLRFVKRREFDHFLATEYQKRGGKLLENTTCSSLDPKGHTATLSSGDTVAFEHLVISDGALSPTAKSLGYDSPELAFCVETHIPKEALPNHTAVGVSFGVVKNGYVWVFPSGKELCVGLGGLYDQSVRYDAILKDFLRTLGVDPEPYPIKGAFLPYGKLVKQSRGMDNVLLVGDAGGFVDPIYGEGLYFALASGIEAAKAISAGHTSARKAFLARMKPYQKIIRDGKRLQKIFVLPASQKYFKKVAQGRNNFVGFYIDHLLAEYDYPYSRLGKLIRDYRREKKTAKA